MSSADAQAAADATALAAGTKTPQQLIVGLPELASADETERLPATAHLAAVLSNLQSANTALPQAAADHILTFLTSRLHDYPCSAPVLGGLHALVNHTHELDAALVQTLTFTLLEEVDVRSLVQAERQAALALTLALAQKRWAALAPSGVRMLLSALRAFDAEKDPRNLIGFLRLLRELTLRCADAPPAALDVALAEIFDALAHYFPIEFSPPPGDPHGVTQPHIVQAYIRALKASAKFAPRVLPWLLDKLADDDQPGAILQALQALALLAPAYGAAAVAPHAQRLSLGLARRVTKLAGIAPDSPLTAAVGECTRAVACAAAGDAQFQIVAAPVDAALAEPPASAGADRAASVLRALLRTPAAPFVVERTLAAMPSRVADGGRPHAVRSDGLALLLALLRAVIDGDGGGGEAAEAGAADGDAAEAEGAAEASRTACVAAIAAGRRPLLESLLACCNDEPAAEAMEVDTPAAAAGDDLRLPAAHSICLALRAAHVAAAADAERGAVVVTAASDANLFRSALATVGKVLLAAAADADADRRHGAAPLAVEISRLRAALTPESMAPLPLGREHVEAAVHSPLLAAFAFAEAGVDDRAAATLPAVARAVGGLCASPGGWAEGAGALRGVIQTRLRAAVGGGDAHALRAVCASVQALTAAPPAQMSAVTKWLVPDLHSLAVGGGEASKAANRRRLLLFMAPLWAKLAAAPASPSLLTAVADYVLAASPAEGRLAAAAPVLLIALIHAPNSTPLPPALLPLLRDAAYAEAGTAVASGVPLLDLPDGLLPEPDVPLDADAAEAAVEALVKASGVGAIMEPLPPPREKQCLCLASLSVVLAKWASEEDVKADLAAISDQQFADLTAQRDLEESGGVSVTTRTIVRVWAWAARGAAGRGGAHVGRCASGLLSLLTGEGAATGMLATEAAAAYGLLLSNSALLRRETGARPPPLLSQRLYETAFKRLADATAGERVLPPYHGALHAAAHCIARAPPALLQRDRATAAPIAVAFLVRTAMQLKTAEPTAAALPLIVGVLRALETLLQPDTTAAADALVPALLELVSGAPSLGAEAQKDLLSAALAALHAAAVLPYHLVAPHRRAVVTALNASLDHPKRAVRRDAARCANAWHTLKKK